MRGNVRSRLLHYFKGLSNFENSSNGREINCKQSARWQHLSQLKASAFLFENYFVRC